MFLSFFFFWGGAGECDIFGKSVLDKKHDNFHLNHFYNVTDRPQATFRTFLEDSKIVSIV